MNVQCDPAVISNTVVLACSKDSTRPMLQMTLRDLPFDNIHGADTMITCSFASDAVLDEFVRQVTQAAGLAKGAAANARTAAAQAKDDVLTAAMDKGKE